MPMYKYGVSDEEIEKQAALVDHDGTCEGEHSPCPNCARIPHSCGAHKDCQYFADGEAGQACP